MIQNLFYHDNHHIQQNLPEAEANWLHVEQPTSEEIAYLEKKYQFPKDYLTAVLDNQEISRHEGLQQATLEKPVLLLLQYPMATLSPSGFKQIEALPFSIIITPTKIITSSNTSLDLLANLDKGKTFHQDTSVPEQLAMHLSWYFASLFNYYLRGIKIETDELEADVQSSTENKQLYQLMDLQKSLVYMDSALQQNLTVFEALSQTDLIINEREGRATLYDIIIETKQASASTDIQAQLLNQLGNIFSAIVSNNMNNVMKALTVITIVLTIPTIIGGIYGMNVSLPFANQENAFWWIAILIISLSVLTIWLLKKNHFL